MKGRTYFGNGVSVTDTGSLQVEFKHPGGVGVQVAKSFKESLEEAIAYAERIGAGAMPFDVAPGLRKHAPN